MTEDIIEINSELLNKFVNLCNITKDYTFNEMKRLCDKLGVNFTKINKSFEKIKESSVEEVELSIAQIQAVNELMEEYNNDEIMFHYLPKNLIVSIASNYDYFINKFLSNIIFDKKFFGIINKDVSVGKIWEYSSKEELLKDCVEDTISDLMRKTHKDQIEWIQKNFSIDLINSFTEWKTVFLFFEVRNIIVHNDGIVNHIFIHTLNKNGISTEEYNLGDKIFLDIDFIVKSIRTLIDFSVYLFSLLMQKLYKNYEEIDSQINGIIYKLLCDKNYGQVISIVDNILKSNQNHTSEYMFIFTINKCIALKNRHNNGYVKILENLDWSNCEAHYRIAKEVLLDNNKEASDMMEKMDKDNMVYNYLEWPLFKDFIKTEEFKNKFNEIYGVNFEDKLEKISEEKASFLADKKILESKCVELLEEVAVSSIDKNENTVS